MTDWASIKFTICMSVILTFFELDRLGPSIRHLIIFIVIETSISYFLFLIFFDYQNTYTYHKYGSEYNQQQMKKQVIVLAFNPTPNLTGDNPSPSVFPGLSLKTNVESHQGNQVFTSQKLLMNTFVPICPQAVRARQKQNGTLQLKKESKKSEEFRLKQEDIDSYRDGTDRVDAQHQKGQKRKKNKGKTDFEIKNVLQQISSSIQSCIKDGYIYSLTDQYLKKLEIEGKEQRIMIYKRNIDRMQFLLNNPTEYNFGCLLKMGNEIHNGLQFIFRSRILKKYIQCSKIRTLKQKSICLEAVDYLFRCFKQQEICSLHTWAHKRDEKLEAKINRLKFRCRGEAAN